MGVSFLQTMYTCAINAKLLLFPLRLASCRRCCFPCLYVRVFECVPHIHALGLTCAGAARSPTRASEGIRALGELRSLNRPASSPPPGEPSSPPPGAAGLGVFEELRSLKLQYTAMERQRDELTRRCEQLGRELGQCQGRVRELEEVADGAAHREAQEQVRTPCPSWTPVMPTSTSTCLTYVLKSRFKGRLSTISALVRRHPGWPAHRTCRSCCSRASPPYTPCATGCRWPWDRDCRPPTQPQRGRQVSRTCPTLAVLLVQSCTALMT